MIAANNLDALVSAAVNGERDAVEGVLRWIRPRVLRYCRARAGSQETSASAEDVAQEVCLAVLKALPSYRDQGRPFIAFVYGIARHKVADAHRSSARKRDDPFWDVPDGPDELTDDPETRVMQDELARRMTKLLDTLPDKQREILIVRIVEGLSAEETAEVVDSTPGAVRVAQHRALQRLRSLLADNDAGKLDRLLVNADIALREKLSAPAVAPPMVGRLDFTRGDYIDQLLSVADAHLRQKLSGS